MKTTRTKRGLAMLLTLCITLFAVPLTVNAAGGQTYTPTNWDEVQSVIDSMNEGDTLDLSRFQLDENADAGNRTLRIAKDITIQGYARTMPTATPFFVHLYIVLDGAEVTLRGVRIANKDLFSVISGTGNLTVYDCELWNDFDFEVDADARPIIDLNGDLTIHGTNITDSNGNTVSTTHISGKNLQQTTGTAKAGDAIHAKNVTVYGGDINGGNDYGARGAGGSAIVASGTVTVKGTYSWGTAYGETSLFSGVNVTGGEGVDGGDGIAAAGDVRIEGGSVKGGDGNGPAGNGGSAIRTGGNVTLAGQWLKKEGDATGEIFTDTYLNSGRGDNYAPGVPIVLTGDDQTPQRLLRIKGAKVSGRNAKKYAAPYTIQMQKNDLAVIDDSFIGWYNNVPIFSEGSYQITNPVNTYGTLDNVTPVQVIDGLVSPGGQSATVTAKAAIPAPAYTVTIPSAINAGELTQKAAGAADKIKSTPFTVSASNVANLFGSKKITVSISAPNGKFELAGGGTTLAYQVYNSDAASAAALPSGGVFHDFTANGSKTGTIKIDQSAITRADNYAGTLTFTIALNDAA